MATWGGWTRRDHRHANIVRRLVARGIDSRAAHLIAAKQTRGRR